MTTVKLDLRGAKSAAPVEVDLDTLTPKARALAEAIAMSPGGQPLGVLVDTGRTKAASPNHTYLHGAGPRADEIGAQPDLRFQTNLEPLPRGASANRAEQLPQREALGSPEEWLEYNARHAMPHDAWPIAGAYSRIQPLAERIPAASIEAAREDRCLTRDQALDYLRDHHAPLTVDAWCLLQKAGNIPQPRRRALGGRMPLWHVDDLDTYATRDVERWPTSRVAEHLGYTGPSAVATTRRQLTRWGLLPIDREPGRQGENRYAADQVTACHQTRPGRGRWADNRQQQTQQ